MVFSFIVQSVSLCLTNCILSAWKAITFLMNFSVLLIAIVTVCLTNTNSSVFLLPLGDGRVLPVFHECSTEEWRAEAEGTQVSNIRVELSIPQLLVTHSPLHALILACFAFSSSGTPVISKPQFRHLENNELLTISEKSE